jgi:hypothetical protein
LANVSEQLVTEHEAFEAFKKQLYGSAVQPPAKVSSQYLMVQKVEPFEQSFATLTQPRVAEQEVEAMQGFKDSHSVSSGV